MAVLKVNDKERRVQYTAAISETTFVYDWSIFADGDLDVYVDEVLKTLNVDYTVTNAGITGGGDVIFVTPMAGTEQIVIVGNLAIDQTVDFTIKANFTGETVQTQFNKLTMISEELNTNFDSRGLLYNVFTTLKANRADNILPQLAANQFWQMNAAGNGISAVELEVDPGANTLRAQLISKQSGSDGALIIGYFSGVLGEIFLHDYLARLESKTDGSDGASIIGYFDSTDSTEKTVKIKLDELVDAQELENLLIGGDFTINPFQRGTAFNPIVDGGFPADRFKYNQTGSMVLKSSVETATPPTVAQTGIFVNKYIRLEVTTGAALAAGDFVTFSQPIEGYNWSRIAQRQFTISFWVRSSIIGTFAIAFKNVDNTISYVTNFSISSASVWEKKSVIIEPSPSAGNWNYENGLGLQAIITLASGATFQTGTLDAWQSANVIASTTQTNFAATTTNSIEFSLMQIQEGIKATNFEVRQFQQELALCQRYFYKTYPLVDPPGTPSVSVGALFHIVQSSGLSSLANLMEINCPVRLRVVPSISKIIPYSSITGAAGFIRDSSANQDLAASAINPGETISYIAPNIGGIPHNIELVAQATIDVEL